MTAESRREQAGRILQQEAAAVADVASLLDEGFDRAVERILGCEGNVVLTGVGKPYLVAQKISASLASTGTPSITIHPTDALHGDLGRIREGDVVIVLSNSGSNDEVVRLVPLLDQLGVFLVAITGNRKSPLAERADAVLCIGKIEEPAPLGVAPASSTTAMMALGDALTLVLAEARGFEVEDFAQLHPGGELGKRLRTVEQAMRPLERTAVVSPILPLLAALQRITGTRSGAAFVVNDAGVLVGIFTDGDLRRTIAENPEALGDPVADHMTPEPKSILPDRKVSEAQELLHHHQVDELPVIDADGKLLGYLDVQDLLNDGG